MKDNLKSHINERLRTEFANSGRAAGTGILEDRYDDESGCRSYGSGSVHVVFPSDYLTDKERESLSGEVKILSKGVNTE